MPTPPLSSDAINQTASALRQALREGCYPPSGAAGRRLTAQSALNRAADILGIPRATVDGRVAELIRRGAWSWGNLPAGSLAAAVPNGNFVPAGLPVEKPRVRVPAGRPAPVAPQKPATWEREKVKLSDENARLRAELKSLRRAEIDADYVREEIFGIAARDVSPPDWLVEAGEGEDGPGTPVFLWSDFHWSEVVRPEEVGGVNEYNTQIAKERVKLLVERGIDLALNHMVGSEHYQGAVVALLGDLINGEIHTELAETNDARMGAALIELADVLVWALEQMAAAFGRLYVPCVVGNHARMSLRPRAKNRVHTSYEFLLYSILERRFKGDDRVRIHVSQDSDLHFKVHNMRFMATHGDALGVKGGDGIVGALGPICRGILKVGASEAQIGRRIDCILMGHWHQHLTLPGAIVNGSLKGWDEFAKVFLRAKHQRPIQALFFVHPRHGITFHVPVFCDKSSELPAHEWVSWSDAA